MIDDERLAAFLNEEEGAPGGAAAESTPSRPAAGVEATPAKTPAPSSANPGVEATPTLSALKGAPVTPGDADLESMERMLASIEEEAAQLQQLAGAAGDTADSDERSVYVGQVDYSATTEELQLHFAECGAINRVTIPPTKFGQGKGYAYIEFEDKESVPKAIALTDSLFKGRQIKVLAKRTNVPGLAARGRGRGTPFRGSPYRGGGGGFRGAGRARGAYRGYHPYY
jgi:polyadenylate-binding protein 2